MAPLYGIDRDIQRKIQSKYSIDNEQEARQWIEGVLGEPFPHIGFYESLKDGVILCKLIGKLLPGQGSFRVSKMPFIQMENIAKFLAGAEKLGVPQFELFQTIDLYEKKNMTQVIDTVFSLSRHAYKAGLCSSFLGPKLSEKHEVEFSQEVLNAGKAMYNPLHYGHRKGANQSGIIFGARREISNVVN
ncbi:calponin homology domain-containing protein [Dichotomocladium elegans]|nr:calponin homology domain-containing protein [Dichotomocladium elegans]